MAKLFISYVGLVSNFCRGEIDEFDLNCGLFYLGRAREEIIVAKGISSLWPFWQLSNDPEARMSVYTALNKSLRQADAEGRVRWRIRGKSPSYSELNEFLDEHREGRIPLVLKGEDGKTEIFIPYSCPGVSARIKKAGLFIDVVY
ncbi:MAG: hypothetical protein ABIB04_00940 [Patescibacteria group bacterium]